MSAALVVDTDLHGMPPATAGELAVLNLDSSLEWAWQVLQRWPDRPRTAERIVDEELRRAQFLGDATALDRLAQLAFDLLDKQPVVAQDCLLAAQIASMRHHFAEARVHVDRAEALGAAAPVVSRIRLALDQAVGKDLEAVLAQRLAMAKSSSAFADLVPLGALHADLGQFEEADRAYLSAIRGYRDTSPFALAWVCFQLGVLWGETAEFPDAFRAAYWYDKAIDYLPAYTHARVHRAELHLGAGELAVAEALLLPILSSGDPEVQWRLAQVLEAQGRIEDAVREREKARSAFESLLARHELAFADHAAEFYLGIGGDPARADALARINLWNRPTRRAVALAQATARALGSERGNRT